MAKRKKPSRPAPKRAPKRKALARAAPTAPAPAALNLSPNQTLAMRQLFWHNVIREILTSLSMLSSMRPSEAPPQADPASPEAPHNDEHAAEAAADAAAGGQPDGPQYDPSLFDGRLAVLTRNGERIAISQVVPLFACGINQDRGLSMALECTVFQISTPDGHVYTVPLHELRAFHALTPQLMQQLEQVARRRHPSLGGEDGEQTPFGFAAFTSLIQGAPKFPEPAPEHPTE